MLLQWEKNHTLPAGHAAARKAKIHTLPACCWRGNTLYQHAAREAKTHTLPAGYAGREGKNYILLAPCCSRHKVLNVKGPKAPRQEDNS